MTTSGRLEGETAPGCTKYPPQVEVQCAIFALPNPYDYPIRLNRLDLTIDLLGLDVADIPFHQWKNQWVGYARPNNLYWDTKTGQNQGFSVGTSHGSVRFKVYDKVREARKSAKYGFWRSVWGLSEEDDEIPVSRFEWTVKCYQGRFVAIRHFEDLTVETFMALLNYATLKWGSLRVPLPNDQTKARWPLTPLWADLVQFISEWFFHYDTIAERDYRFEPDISEPYLRYVTGALAGLLTRLGFELGEDGPVSVAKGLSYLHQAGHTMAHIEEKAARKWRVFAHLNTRGDE